MTSAASWPSHAIRPDKQSCQAQMSAFVQPFIACFLNVQSKQLPCFCEASLRNFDACLPFHLPPEVVQISATTLSRRVGASVREFLRFGTQSFNIGHCASAFVCVACIIYALMHLHFIVRSYCFFLVFAILAAFMLTCF